MAQNIIVAEMVQSNKSNNYVWHVHVKDSDNPEHQGFCRTAAKAIHFAFILKGRTGLYIDNDTLDRLMWYHQQDKDKAQASETAAQSETESSEEPALASVPVDSTDGDNTPKKQRRARRTTKKEAE